MKKTTAQINVHRAGTASYKSSKLLDSKKAADKREAMMKCKRPEKFCAYVGNLHPLTTVVEVTDLFEHCDGLSEVRLRVGHGSAQEAKPDMYFDDLDVQYATVEVSEWNGLVQAMKLNGTVVRGRRIVVGLTSAVLPEMDKLFYEHYHGDGSLQRKKFGRRPLRAEPTEIITETKTTGLLDKIAWFKLPPIQMPVTLM